MSFLPGMFPAAVLSSGLYVPASYSFIGDEGLFATQVGDSSDPTKCTISFWMKTSDTIGDEEIPGLVGSFLDTANYAGATWFDNSDYFAMDHYSSGYRGKTAAAGSLINDGAWHHYFACWNSTLSSASRVVLRVDGADPGSSAYSAPGASASFLFFQDGRTVAVGNDFLTTNIIFKLAFVEVLDGVAASYTDFAFDNGGTWTRKRYSGSYGTHGFLLDGTAGFVDVANGRVFSGTNMDASNIDTADLPPYTN